MPQGSGPSTSSDKVSAVLIAINFIACRDAIGSDATNQRPKIFPGFPSCFASHPFTLPSAHPLANANGPQLF
jgi:hypothetical protein